MNPRDREWVKVRSQPTEISDVTARYDGGGVPRFEYPPSCTFRRRSHSRGVPLPLGHSATSFLSASPSPSTTRLPVVSLSATIVDQDECANETKAKTWVKLPEVVLTSGLYKDLRRLKQLTRNNGPYVQRKGKRRDGFSKEPLTVFEGQSGTTKSQQEIKKEGLVVPAPAGERGREGQREPKRILPEPGRGPESAKARPSRARERARESQSASFQSQGEGQREPKRILPEPGRGPERAKAHPSRARERARESQSASFQSQGEGQREPKRVLPEPGRGPERAKARPSRARERAREPKRILPEPGRGPERAKARPSRARERARESQSASFQSQGEGQREPKRVLPEPGRGPERAKARPSRAREKARESQSASFQSQGEGQREPKRVLPEPGRGPERTQERTKERLDVSGGASAVNVSELLTKTTPDSRTRYTNDSQDFGPSELPTRPVYSDATLPRLERVPDNAVQVSREREALRPRTRPRITRTG
ncbi:pre-mRNA-splicing factor 38B-like [Penaeus vannamei]|uniref:pre-mRNA-splicing factor 38B-like n=1 Tax=Penaeus vannamei TaxID=6689 RepID=UPI00387F4D08